MIAGDISVLLVDDHAVVREGYRRLLELNADVHVCGEAADAAQAYQRFCGAAAGRGRDGRLVAGRKRH